HRGLASSAAYLAKRSDQVREPSEIGVRAYPLQRAGGDAHGLAERGQGIELSGDQPVPSQEDVSRRPRRVSQHGATSEVDCSLLVPCSPTPARKHFKAVRLVQ